MTISLLTCLFCDCRFIWQQLCLEPATLVLPCCIHGILVVGSVFDSQLCLMQCQMSLFSVEYAQPQLVVGLLVFLSFM